MEYVVLDTDVASRILRHRLAGPFAARLAGRTWCVSFVTVGELWKWAELRSWGQRSRDQLADWLRGIVVLPGSANVSHTWGRPAAAAERRGRPRPANDSWIAATCVARGLPLATSNVKDFVDYVDHEGLTLLTG